MKLDKAHRRYPVHDWINVKNSYWYPGDPTVIGGKYLLNQEALMLQEKDLTKGITIML